MKKSGWVLIGVVAIVVLAVLWMRNPQPSSTLPTTRPVVRVASRPLVKPKAQKTVEMAMIASPREMGIAKDSTVNRLISRHNQLEDSLQKVLLKGNCVWLVDSPTGTPQPMSIAFDRARDEAELKCGPRWCTVRGGKVTMDVDGAMTMDALY